MKRALHILRQIDRVLPVALFAVLLSVQGLLATGAADSIVFPQLLGPDGRTLTFADICNSASENGDAAKHCGACSFEAGKGLAAHEPFPLFPLASSNPRLPGTTRVLPKTPERWQYHRRGPPLS